jgi:type 1 glutamine amidotransferase
VVNIHVRDDAHPVTRGMTDFALRDETYDDYYVEPGITPLLITDNQGSSPVIGWAKTYGRARVVTIQPGHDAKTFGDPHYRKLLLQAIQWVYQTRNCPGN